MVGKLLSAGVLGSLAVMALPAAAADQAVSFGTGLVYTPSAVHVAAGETVTFTPEAGNDFATTGGATHHPLDFVDPAIPDQTSGAGSASRTFAQPGTYTFFCRNHGAANGSGMAGTVTVDPPSPAPPPPPGPPTTAPSTTPTTTSTQPTSTAHTPAPAPGASDTSAPALALKRLTLRSLRHRSAVIRFTASEAGRASATLSARGIVLGRGAKTVSAAGTQALPLKPTKAGRRLLRRAARVKAQLRLTVRDAAGNAAALTRSVTLRA